MSREQTFRSTSIQWGLCIPMGITVFFLTAPVAFSAEWIQYFENQAGIRFYIDNGSILRSPKETILVWEKAESTDTASVKMKVEQLREVDCSRRRYKILQRTVYDNLRRTFGPDKNWKYFEPNDLDEARYEAMCEKSKR